MSELYIDEDQQFYEKSYSKGYEEGLLSAENKSYEAGFKDGVQVCYNLIKNGVQMGYYIGYLQMIKRWISSIDSDNNEKKIKLLSKYLVITIELSL